MIPLAILLIPFLFVSLFYIVMSGGALYHIFRFNFVTMATISAMIIFGVGTLIIFSFSFYTFSKIKWSTYFTTEQAFCCPSDQNSNNFFGL